MGNGVKVIGKRRYGVNKINIIRDKLQGYLDRAAIASEMIQNADDAGASLISFHFRNEALIVRNNSHFTDKDFDNILDIASGGKREEQGKIGAWGTGFLCAFRLSDAPELFSSAKHFIFEPTKDELDELEGHIGDGTEFRLPWRRKSTALGQHLEAPTWSDENIEQLKQETCKAIYRLAIHLRHVTSIDIYEGDTDEKLLCHIHKRLKKVEHLAGFDFEQWEIEYKRAGVATRIDSWLYYRTEMPHDQDWHEVTIKDFHISLAFPLEERDWLKQHVPGALYNFLPTPLETGFAFQVNGAFFPDSNRRGILIDEAVHPEKSLWNRCVINALAQLFTSTLIHIRDQVKDPDRFYNLLPLEKPSPGRAFLWPIHETFVDAARELPIVYTTLGEWRRPQEIYLVQPQLRAQRNLGELAAEYMPLLPQSAPQSFRQFLHNKLGSADLRWQDVVAWLGDHLEEGVKLPESHAMISSRKKLGLLYEALPHTPHAEDRQILSTVPLCLLEDGTLWPFDEENYRASKETRELVRQLDFLFVDIGMQEQFNKLFEALVNEFKGADLVVWFNNQDWPETPFPLKHVRQQIRSPKHLADMLRFIKEDLENVEQEELARAPIVLTHRNLLACSTDDVFLYEDKDERNRLQQLGIEFVNPDFATDEQILAVYEQADVATLEAQDVVQAIRACHHDWAALPRSEIVSRLTTAYEYLARHRHRIMPEDKQALRELPICLTQQGRLVDAGHVYRPRDNFLGERVQTHINKLQLDNLVAGELLNNGGCSDFIKYVLEIETISPAALIRDFIIPNYRDQRLDDSARKDLLDYIQGQMQILDGNDQSLWPILKQAALIRCDDGQYRKGSEIYFASPMLDTAISSGYKRLHSSYGVTVASTADEDQTPYKSHKWYWLFNRLGVNEQPTPDDLYHAIERVVSSGPPDEKRTKAVERIYDFLYKKSHDRAYFENSKLKLLPNLDWLPARNDNERWHQPGRVFRPGDAELIGNRAPVMRFNEPTVELRAFLGIPERPPAELIASHLFECAKLQKEVSPFVYRDLGRRWTELDPTTQGRLAAEAIVWDTRGSYWRGRQVFFQDLARLFGSRRCYLDHKSGDIQKFLVTIGAKPSPHQIDDSIELLKEIAADYSAEQVVSDADRKLIHRNFEHLGQMEPIEDIIKIRDLRALAIVPGRDGRMHLPNRIVIETHRSLLDQFDYGTIAIVSDERLNEPVKCLLRAIGVRFLNEVVHRRLIEATDRIEDARLRLHIRQLTPHFKRIAYHLREQNGDVSVSDLPIEQLRSVEIYSCSKLLAQYELNDKKGWQVFGNTREENALYDNERNILFVKRTQSGELDILDLALELDRLLFPTSKKSEAIENLLKLPLTNVESYLDRHGYMRPITDQLEEGDEDAFQGNLISIPAPPEPAPAPATTQIEESKKPYKHMQDSFTHEQHVEAPHAKDVGAVRASESDARIKGEQAGKAIPVGSSHTCTQPGDKDRLDSETGKAAPRITKSETPQQTAASRMFQSPQGENNAANGVPPFAGRTGEMTPVLGNDYRELRKRFGLTRFGDSDLGATESDEDSIDVFEDDWALSDESWSQGPNDTKEIKEVRFTLRYGEWANGYLRLHARARQMLNQLGNPKQLMCQVAYDAQTFELFVSYSEEVIYTRENELADLFQAHNIPAGGIIYLEYIHGVTFRLSWRQSLSRIEDVMLLLLHEDGSLERTTIPAAEFPCEVSEYVLRAEKRFEDGDALFAQAIGKHGVFQTICDIFGEPEVELSYGEIFNAMMQEHRWVSADTIRFELARRPCFVSVGNDCWRFDPSKGWQSIESKVGGKSRSHNGAPRRPQRRQPQGRGGRAPMGGDIPLGGHLPSEQADINGHTPLLKLARSEWQEMNKILQANGRDATESLRHFIEAIRLLVSRLERELRAQEGPSSEGDELLQSIWLKVESDPGNKASQDDLASYIMSSDCIQVLSELRLQLDNTRAESCDLVFFPLLGQIAHRALNEEHVEKASSLYNLLYERGAGDFSDKFAQIERHNQIQEYVELSKIAQSQEERWQLWQEVWPKHQGIPFLRRAIQEDFRAALDRLGSQVTHFLQHQDVSSAFQESLSFVACVNPVADAWSADQMIKGAWQTIRRVFGALIEKARALDGEIGTYKQALETAAMLPLDEQKHLHADDYLEAIEAVAEDFRSHSNTTAAIALVDYGLRLVEHNNQIVREKIKIRLREYASRLCEEQGYFEQAYEFLKSIRPDNLSRERVNLLSNRRYELHKKLDSKATDESKRLWRTEIEKLTAHIEFTKLISDSGFRQLML